MRRKLKYFLTILWFTYLIVSSILLFSKGFLLTREVHDKNSSCSSLKEIYCSEDSTVVDQCTLENKLSLLQNVYDKASSICIKSDYKVILLIVDALRFDFTVYNQNNDNPLPYENKLPVIKHVLDIFPNSSRLYKFIADPPTTTMQRLKALTTGSLPTFIDAGSNFATSEINEDNIIDQAIKNNETVVFMGDDTWTSLYPNRFVRNYPYPSFDVWDLDTVDDGVKNRLFPELNNTDWNLLIGHFLGVDHCGHRYGPNHPEMTRKLLEINDVIEEVIKVMDDKSVLFVIGDHGMTVTGDHGGESTEEVEAALFIYSKQPLLHSDKKPKSVKQVDLVPTLSAILGIPVPFQNLGILIESALPTPLSSSSQLNSWQLSLFWLWGNAQQIITYIKTYSNSTHIFDEEYLNLYFSEFDRLHAELNSVDFKEASETFSKKVVEFLMKIRILCEEVWIQFDAFSISNGLTLSFLSVFFMFIISDGIPLKYLPLAIEGSFVVVCVIGLSFSAVAVALLYFSKVVEEFLYSCIFITNILSHLMFLLPLFQNWDVISINWYVKNKTNGIIDLVCRFVLIFNIFGVFSNSFINEESSLLFFLLVTVIILSILDISPLLTDPKRKNESISIRTFIKLSIASVLVLSLLRTSMFFWRCRVEQEWCFKSPHEINNKYLLKSESSKLQWGLSVMSLSLLIILMKMWLRKCGNLNGYSITEMYNKLIPSVMIVCIAGFWVLQRLAGNSSSISRTSNYLALSVYVLFLISVLVLLSRPVCISIIMRNGNSFDLDSQYVIPNIFNRLKLNFKQTETNDNMPIVCGLGTVFSAAYIILGTYLVLLIALLLGDTFSFSVIIMAVVGIFFLLTTSIMRLKQAHTINDLLNVPTLAVMGWIVISQYFFYAFGHQPAFPNIAWESAFVGTSGLFNSNYILGSLVLLNTFGSHILAGISLPLLVIAPFTLLVMAPSLLGKQKEFYASAQKGEMILFEKDRMATAALFAVTCKYIAGHTVKVFATMLAATIHSRHLMVWNVFAPKFIFEAIGLFITLGSVLAGYLIFLRINSQVERLINRLNKMH